MTTVFHYDDNKTITMEIETEPSPTPTPSSSGKCDKIMVLTGNSTDINDYTFDSIISLSTLTKMTGTGSSSEISPNYIAILDNQSANIGQALKTTRIFMQGSSTSYYVPNQFNAWIIEANTNKVYVLTDAPTFDDYKTNQNNYISLWIQYAVETNVPRSIIDWSLLPSE